MLDALRSALWHRSTPSSAQQQQQQQQPLFHRSASLDSTSSDRTAIPSLSDSTSTPTAAGDPLEKQLLHSCPSSIPRPSTSARWITPRLVSDATIGLSDGLTVPFALTAGLSALGDPRLVIYGGLAELFAGAISMGVGGYLGARGEAQAYAAAVVASRRHVALDTPLAKRQVCAALEQYGLSALTLERVAGELAASPEAMEEFLLRFHHGLSEESGGRWRAYASGLVIAAGYFFGGLMPLLPYLFCRRMEVAFWWSCGVMTIVLFAFGWAKTALVGGQSKTACFWNGLQMLLLGGSAALAAMGCIKAISGGGHG